MKKTYDWMKGEVDALVAKGEDIAALSSSEIVKQDADSMLESGASAPRITRLEAFLKANEAGAALLAEFDAAQ